MGYPPIGGLLERALKSKNLGCINGNNANMLGYRRKN